MTSRNTLSQFVELERRAATMLEEIQLAVRLLRTLGPVMEQMQELQSVIAQMQDRLQAAAPPLPRQDQ